MRVGRWGGKKGGEEEDEEVEVGRGRGGVRVDGWWW